MLINLVKASLKLTLGMILGLLLLESIFYVNPHLLPHGIPGPAPSDWPLTQQEYDVYYTDADIFVWRPDLIAPVPPDQNQLEGHVILTADQFGFRNPPPLSEKTEYVVVGRSWSLGAQIAQPWPEFFAQKINQPVLNLSQPSSSIEQRQAYIQKYAVHRNPTWLIIEIIPSLDVIGFQPNSDKTLTIKPILRTILQYFLKFNYSFMPNNQAIFPIKVNVTGQTYDLTCCTHYIEALSIDAKTMTSSIDWELFSRALLELIVTAQQQNMCVALINAPGKPNIFFPLVEQPANLSPIIQKKHTYKLNPDNQLVPDTNTLMDVDMLVNNVWAGRDALQAFAAEHDLLFIDPIPALSQALINGQNPFMIYDGHLNQLGHQLVAETVQQAFANTTCK